ncbi:MAG: Thiosulfate sulfurtransferase, rhodanese [uncultured Nocardioidaceae bacterium]|uniref:Sulfurtransferase n=1 Tax=uncultured Nocardioidaceae bacterium TaxID=253824 RepID=A0A6J4M4A2_9ACTN|nr:MAG: Thiosulfate sulfurtransferase, rhodanese [uncultured Nocardioidaceae bacterium]
MSPLITPEELLADGLPRTLLDVRWQLGSSDGRAEHEAGHLPGAAFVDLDADLADPPGERGRHPLPDPARFGEAMRRCGVSGSRGVVVYDDSGGTAAARAWWLLRHHGHADVRLLDGGWSEWRRLGSPVETGVVAPAYGDFEPHPGGMPVVDATGAASVARSGSLVDARAPERFRGDVEPVDPVAGHVPGAVNVPTARNLEPEGPRTGRFRSVEGLREAYGPVLQSTGGVAVYCGSGVTAAHDVLALELIGVAAALYPGSWSEWVTDSGRPVARG